MATDVPTLRKARNAKRIGKMVGSGCFRKVFRTGSSKWAYKFDKSEGSTGNGSNYSEYQTYLAIKDSGRLPESVRLPEMHLLEGNILAVEYVKGKHPDNWCDPDYHVSRCPGKDKCWAGRFQRSPIRDMHNQNVILTKDGTLYLIDLGHGLS